MLGDWSEHALFTWNVPLKRDGTRLTTHTSEMTRDDDLSGGGRRRPLKRK